MATKINNGQLPDVIKNKTIDTSNDIDTTTTKLTITGGTNGQVLKTDGSGNLSWITAGGGVTDGDKGDISVTASGATWTIDNGVVTLAKMANLPSSRLIGRGSTSTGVPEQITLGTGLTMTGSQLQTSSIPLSSFSTLDNTGVLGGIQAGNVQVLQTGGATGDFLTTSGLFRPNVARIDKWTNKNYTTANVTSSTSTSLTNLTALTQTINLSGYANVPVHIELYLLINRQTSGSNPGYKLNMRATGSGTFGGYFNLDGDHTNNANITTTNTLDYDFLTAESGTFPSIKRFTGVVMVSASTTLTLTVSFAQKITDAGNPITVYAWSQIKYRLMSTSTS